MLEAVLILAVLIVLYPVAVILWLTVGRQSREDVG